jgi:hypothetical protein
MFERNYGQFTGRILLVTSLAFGLTVTTLESVQANGTRVGENNRGWPTRRVGGGSRTGCTLAARPCTPLLALVPDGLLQTASNAPTLFFYVPSIESSEKVQIELVIRDENDRLVYERTFPTTGREGILEVTLNPSATFPGLEIDRSYHWYLSIIRDPGDRSRDDLVEGWVKRVSPPIASRPLAELTPLERVLWYESAQLWPETLSELVRLQRSHPGDLQVSRLWQETIAALQLPFSMGEAIVQNPKLSAVPNF